MTINVEANSLLRILIFLQQISNWLIVTKRVIIIVNDNKYRRSTNPLFNFKVQRVHGNHESNWNCCGPMHTQIFQVRPGAQEEDASPVYMQHPSNPFIENESNLVIF